jgi:hypothetical protein
LATLGDATQIVLLLFFVALTKGSANVSLKDLYMSVLSLSLVIVASIILPTFANVNTAIDKQIAHPSKIPL